MGAGVRDPKLPTGDLESILEVTEPLWETARKEAIVLTGGTGFFGRWLLESFSHINARLALGARIVVLTRDPEAFRSKAPRLTSDAAIQLVAGDVRSFGVDSVREQLGGKSASARFVIHAATTVAAPGVYGSLETIDTIVNGTRAALDFARDVSAERFLFTSSGAVYGAQPRDQDHISEEFSGGPDCTNPASAYGEAKRLAEVLCSCMAAEHQLTTTIARCYAFLGPHMPLDAQFAIGNFLRDVLKGRPIRVSGDGSARRSYMYASDLAVGLWTLLFRGAAGRAYNVGSEESVSIKELAERVSRLATPTGSVDIAQPTSPDSPVARYVPSTARLRRELGFVPSVDLSDGLARTLEWYRRGT